ncbi:hypothetical protein F5X98DRAFT_379621 [Xylaria grammica]|nr:hypothetical protein F5X98DRAFT_379621 [Xylaria grammica]
MLFAEKLSDGYLAGIWRSDLRGIMWSYPSIPMTPPKLLLQCQLEISTIIDGQNSFGRVKGGQLTITGPTIDTGPSQDGEEVSLFLDSQVDTEQECHG